VIHLPIPEDYAEYAHWCTDQENQLMEENPNLAIMYTRAAHKVLKTSSIISVFNADTSLTLDWAKQLFDFEIQNIDPIINNDSPINAALTSAMGVIVKLLQGKYHSRNTKLPGHYKELNMFTESTFKQAAQNRPAIRDCGTSPRYGNPKSGAKVILEYMLNEGYIRKAAHKGRSVSYQVTQLFQETYNG
jgi:hypothetical protein